MLQHVCQIHTDIFPKMNFAISSREHVGLIAQVLWHIGVCTWFLIILSTAISIAFVKRKSQLTSSYLNKWRPIPLTQIVSQAELLRNANIFMYLKICLDMSHAIVQLINSHPVYTVAAQDTRGQQLWNWIWTRFDQSCLPRCGLVTPQGDIIIWQIGTEWSSTTNLYREETVASITLAMQLIAFLDFYPQGFLTRHKVTVRLPHHWASQSS